MIRAVLAGQGENLLPAVAASSFMKGIYMSIKRILALLLAVSMLFGLFGCKASENAGEDTTSAMTEESTAADTTKKEESGDNKEDDTDKKDEVESALDLSPKAVWSETTVVTQNMYLFYFNSFYRYYLQSNSNRLEELGLDPSKSLSSQKQSDKYNWQQYFTLEVYRQLREMIALADTAKEKGISLDGKDRKDVDGEMASYKSQAEKSGFSEAEFFEKTYGKGVTAADVRACVELRLLANKYYTKTWESYSFTEDEKKEYYDKNKDKFLYFDCITNTVPKEDASVLLECKDSESFLATMKDIIVKNNFGGDYDRFADSVDSLIDSKTVKRVSCNNSNETVKWALGKDRKAFDVYSENLGEDKVTVTMLLPCENEKGAVSEVLYRDEEPLRNVMCIIFGDSEGTTGLVKANTIYKNWQEDPTADHFGSLMLMYKGSETDNIYRSLLNAKVESWLFEEGRKEGDCAVIEEDGGAYLVYAKENGEATWLYEVGEDMKETAYSDEVDNAIDTHPTQYDGDFVYNVIEVSVK